MADSVEQFLNRLHHPMLASIDLSLDRIQRLLSMLRSPQLRLPPVIHVAGTNGKGSLLANLKAMFEAAGYRVHRYTSPHLVHFRERIVLNGKEIDDALLMSLLKHMAPILSQQPATFFEATTALAFLAFAEHKADVLLLETGLGGKLDATNVIEKPLLTAITPIAFDHMEQLGDTLEKIATKKAGILKEGVACVVGKQEAEAAAVIASRAKTLNAPLYRMGYEWRHDNGVYHSSKRSLAFQPGLEGSFQYDNAATAIACLDLLPNFTITDKHIAEGLAHVDWPARLQRLSPRNLPPNIELWLDGGHNAQGGQVLAEWLKTKTGKEIHLICGMVKGKDAKAFLAPLASCVTSFTAIPIPEEPTSQDPGELAAVAASLGMRTGNAPTMQKALQTITGHAKTPALICICGSLYLAGKVLASMESLCSQ